MYGVSQQTRLARSCRIINGKIISVKVHGAVECINPSCISFNAIKPQDPYSETVIAISGALDNTSSTHSQYRKDPTGVPTSQGDLTKHKAKLPETSSCGNYDKKKIKMG
ncbi:7082_t:CDS:2 [Entrophospora sp. SA101]|nr:7082_t:CDS:2 [Entrophospora sp. SA101]